MLNINLLPSSQRPTVVIFDRTLAIGLTLIAVELLAILGFSIYENRVISDLNNQYADISQRVIVEQQAVKEVDDLRDQAAQLQQKAELLERIKESPLQLAEILTDLRYQDPRGLWFIQLTINHSTAGGSVSIQGKTSTYRDVADMMLNLDSSRLFGNATLNSATQQVDKGQAKPGGIGFTMSGQLSPAVVGQ
ncbi:MAG: PilN domain-containing protein [Candidatus Eremiobacteraeota bacterium]|nr:PilN domain-containing protein [Candidatus Eremiobacteraeota bacterium]MBV8367115.1 PilN domain-containing protein [Candidatus Eremiobacteraeota bacterium]